MKRRGLLVAIASGLGLLAGCTGNPGSPGESSPGDETPTGSPTPTPVVDGTPPTDTFPSSDPITPTGSPTEETVIPINPREEFPEGPKEPPEPPDSFTLESVRKFVHDFEYRYVYNSLWYDESTEVHNECEIDSAEQLDTGYEVVVSCTAYSNTGGEPVENGTATTTVVHADYFTQTYVYLVTQDSITRRAYQGETSPTESPPPSST